MQTGSKITCQKLKHMLSIIKIMWHSRQLQNPTNKNVIFNPHVKCDMNNVLKKSLRNDMNKNQVKASFIPVSCSIFFLWKSNFLRESLLKLSVAANGEAIVTSTNQPNLKVNSESAFTNLIEENFHH